MAMGLTSQRNKKYVILLVLTAMLVISFALPAQADDDKPWENLTPDESDVNIDGSVKFDDDLELSAITKLFIYLLQWIFGIVGLILAAIIVFVGINIARTSANPKERTEVGGSLGKLILGAGLCFGAFFLISVMRGVFFS